jgi:protein phosphatase
MNTPTDPDEIPFDAAPDETPTPLEPSETTPFDTLLEAEADEEQEAQAETAAAEPETRNPEPAPSTPAAPPALPEATPHEPPRPLTPGAFLRGEFEIKEVIERGPVNFYVADNGDYDAPLPLLIAERHAHDDAIEAPAVEVESPQPGAQPLASALFPPRETFAQDEREYSVFNYEPTAPLSDRRETANDARYLAMLSTLAEGLLELEQHGLVAELSPDTLRFDEKDELRYYGFFEPRQQNAEAAATAGLGQLREINGFLLRRVFATTSTMRLDDEFGALAFCEETKALATALARAEYSSLEEAVAAIRMLAPRSTLRVDAALLSDVGRERELNEDCGAIFKLWRAGHMANYEIEVYAVADGMGGHEGGEVASDRTIATLHDAVQRRAGLDWNDNTIVRAALLEIIDEVNAAVVALTEEPQYRRLRARPGATLVFALRFGPRAFIGNVGDSRAYKWSAAHGLQRISKDHSYVQNLIDQEVLAEEEAWGHPEGSIITAHIGLPKLRQKDVFLRLFAPGDKLLLVSDGVVDMLRESEIEPLLREDDAAATCRALVDAANEAGGADNITAACVAFA